MARRMALALTVILLTTVHPASAEEGNILRIGIVPFYTPEKIWQLYQPFIEYLNRSTPHRWELKLVASHDELIDGLCGGTIQVGYLGPMPYGKSLEKCRPAPLVISLGPDGESHYHSILVTADPAVRSLRDLRGRKMALYQNSTASYFLPLQMLRQEGITQADVVPVYFQAQDRIVAAVLSKEVSAGGIKESLYLRFKDNLRPLQTSDPLPHFVFAASPTLPGAAGRALASSLLAVKPVTDPNHREMVKHWDPELAHGFTLPPEAFVREVETLYRSLRQVPP